MDAADQRAHHVVQQRENHHQHGEQHHFDDGEDGDRAQHGAQRKHIGKVESAGVKTGGGHDLRHLIEHADHVQQQPQQRHRDNLVLVVIIMWEQLYDFLITVGKEIIRNVTGS